MRLLLAAGWLAHLASWAIALARSGRSAAGAGEWVRELALRGAILCLCLAAIGWPAAPAVRLSPLLTWLILLAFLSGHALAVIARTWLGDSWTVGVRPRATGRVVRSGPYRVLAHPIYAGTALAILAQLALVQNLAALLLAVGAAVVIPLKAARERRWLTGRGSNPGKASAPPRDRSDALR